MVPRTLFPQKSFSRLHISELSLSLSLFLSSIFLSSVDQNQPNSMSSIPTYDKSSSFTSLISSHEQKVIDHELLPYYDGSNSTPTKKKIFLSDGEKTGSVKWMSSKMRLMGKLRSNIHVPQNQGEINGSRSSNNGTSSDNLTRVCSACNTTKTPLWRGGPQGPKSLCNACGIRQRKARKTMAEAETEAARKTQITISSNKIGSDAERKVVPYKKRCKFFSSEDHEELQLEDLSIKLNRSSDVKEAAILLMGLSSDIICG